MNSRSVGRIERREKKDMDETPKKRKIKIKKKIKK
jgi:hypothetical protein